MCGSPDLEYHAGLVERMAEAVGVDLMALPPGARQDAVRSCTTCQRVSACETFLDTATQPDQTAPDYCRNVDLFDLLREVAPRL